jgi:hypothetical protein
MGLAGTERGQDANHKYQFKEYNADVTITVLCRQGSHKANILEVGRPDLMQRASDSTASLTKVLSVYTSYSQIIAFTGSTMRFTVGGIIVMHALSLSALYSSVYWSCT